MARTGPRTPTIECRILAALRIATRQIADAAERLVDAGAVLPGWRRVRWVGTCWTYRLAEQSAAFKIDSAGGR